MPKYTRECICLNMHMYAHFASLCLYKYLCVHIYPYEHICMCLSLCACMFGCVCCEHVCKCVCVNMCVCVCVYICVLCLCMSLCLPIGVSVCVDVSLWPCAHTHTCIYPCVPEHWGQTAYEFRGHFISKPHAEHLCGCLCLCVRVGKLYFCSRRDRACSKW